MVKVPDPRPASGDAHLALARDSLRELLNDKRVPPPVRAALAEDYRQLQLLLEKIEHGHIHIAVFGRVSVGKSALLNALLGETRFSTSPLHGETTRAAHARWQEYDAGGVFLIDTPGINEVAGEEREQLAHDVASRSDLVMFVVDGDITDSELRALRQVKGAAQRLVLVLNKIDRYTQADGELLLATLRQRTEELIQPRDILTAAAQPAERIVILVDAEGNETETRRRPSPDVTALRERIWDILKAEGKTMAALNAGLFAGRFSDRLSRESSPSAAIWPEGGAQVLSGQGRGGGAEPDPGRRYSGGGCHRCGDDHPPQPGVRPADEPWRSRLAAQDHFYSIGVPDGDGVGDASGSDGTQGGESGTFDPGDRRSAGRGGLVRYLRGGEGRRTVLRPRQVLGRRRAETGGAGHPRQPRPGIAAGAGSRRHPVATETTVVSR